MLTVTALITLRLEKGYESHPLGLVHTFSTPPAPLWTLRSECGKSSGSAPAEAPGREREGLEKGSRGEGQL